MYSAATRKLVVEYEELCQRFMTGTTVNQFKALFPASAAPCKLLAGKVTVTLKLKAYWGGNVVHELETFASILDLSGGHFHLYMAKRGCIAVVWLCSTSFVEKQLKAVISEIPSSLLQLKGVLQIFIGDDLVWKPAGNEIKLLPCAHMCSRVMHLVTSVCVCVCMCVYVAQNCLFQVLLLENLLIA